MTQPRIITFGCRLNAFESEVMRGHALAAGRENAIIVNTCAVTAEATRQARQAIRRARRERPDAEIIVTGCAAQLSPLDFANMPEVDRVLGNSEKMTAEAWAAESETPVAVSDIMAVKETAGHLVDGFEGRARAFLQVQNGCDHRCTFCIIPFARGPNRSVPMGAVIEQAERLVANGYRELVLTGVDITDYGVGLPGRPRLGGLVRRLLDRVPGLERLRLSSLDPVEVDGELLDLISDQSRIMPHLHLSLQAGDDMVLKRMKRRHGRADAVAFCRDLRRRRPDVVFGADLIAGFPTETEEMFENTLRLVEDCGLTHLHVFPYSARPGTPAAAMPQVAGGTVRARAARLRREGDSALARYLGSRVGMVEQVLMETARTGRTEHYVDLGLNRDAEPGTIVSVRVHASDGRRLMGDIDV